MELKLWKPHPKFGSGWGSRNAGCRKGPEESLHTESSSDDWDELLWFRRSKNSAPIEILRLSHFGSARMITLIYAAEAAVLVSEQ